jgi:hypothetical protein
MTRGARAVAAGGVGPAGRVVGSHGRGGWSGRPAWEGEGVSVGRVAPRAARAGDRGGVLRFRRDARSMGGVLALPSAMTQDR